MENFFEDYETLGLPGGPNELKRFTNGFIISERGQWDYPGQPTAVPTPSGRITMEGVEDDLLGIDNLGNTQYMTPGNEYQFEGDMVYEIPQAKKGGSKKPSKKYSRSLMAKNRLFAKNPLFKKKKSAKNKIFDPNSPYFQPGGETDAMNAMMKARLAYANEFGNPSAQRMIVIPDQPYDFGDGNYGTHYMASIDNYAVPQIQSVNGVLQIGDYGPESSEAIRFDSDEDANYFAENYKSISPGFMEVELDDNEIEEYRRGGYIVEDISVPSLTKASYGHSVGNLIRKQGGGEKTCPPGKVWSHKDQKCVYLIQHENYPKNSPVLNNFGEKQIISSDPFQSLGDYGPDGFIENIVEFGDPTGALSWDDARESYNEWQNSKNTYPTFNQSLSMFGAVPALGKLSKIKYLKNTGQFSKAAFGLIPWQQILNTIDTGQDIKKDNINSSIEKTKKSEWNPPLIKKEVVVKPKKKLIKKDEGGFIAELDDNEIKKYLEGGYIVEELD